MMDGMEWMWGLGGLTMIVFWVVAVVLLLAGIKFLFAGSDWMAGGSATKQGGRDTESRALAILEERYAQGEIGREEFLQKRQDVLKRS
jgi:putative membrane protein